jgi:hypothetical protein
LACFSAANRFSDEICGYRKISFSTESVKRSRWFVVIIERMWEVVEASVTISLRQA